MGHVPLLVFMPRSAEQFLAMRERELAREMRGRRSFFGWRRRRAYRACLTLIKAREAALGFTDDPWEIKAPTKAPTPSPAERQLFELQRGLICSDPSNRSTA